MAERSDTAANDAELDGVLSPALLTATTNVPKWPVDYSLLCFNKRSVVRRACRWLVGWPPFGNFVVLAIIVSSVCLALDTPRLDPTSRLALHLRRLDYFFTALFTLELLAKVFAYDLLVPPDENGENGGYLLSTWNLLVSHARSDSNPCTKKPPRLPLSLILCVRTLSRVDRIYSSSPSH